MAHQNLAVASWRGTDADCGYVDIGGYLPCKLLRYLFQHQGEGARFGYRPGVAPDPLCIGSPALHTIASKRVYRLRRQAHMGHDRYAARGKEADGFRDGLAALDLYR